MSTYLWRENGAYRLAYIIAVCVMLVLTKDAGLLMALMIGLAYIMVELMNNTKWTNKARNIILITAGISLPKLLWNYKIQVSGINKAFSKPYDFKEIIEIMTGNGQSYRAEVWSKYLDAYKTTVLGDGLLKFTCLQWAIIFYIAIAAIMFLPLIKRNKRDLCLFEDRIIVYGFLLLTYVIFVLGICFSYMYKFAENEALELASFSRYISIIYTTLWIFFVIMIATMEIGGKFRSINLVMLLSMVMIVAPVDYAQIFIRGYSAKNSIEFRKEYANIQNDIRNTNADIGAKFCFITQGDNKTFDYMICKFIIRPYVLIDDKTFNEEMKPDELMDWLNEYDYLVLCKPNEMFHDNYNELFENEFSVTGIYYIDKNRGRLILDETKEEVKN